MYVLVMRDRSHGHVSTLQRFGRREYDIEIVTHVLERIRFSVDIPEFEGRDLGAAYRIFHREDDIIRNFDKLTGESELTGAFVADQDAKLKSPTSSHGRVKAVDDAFTFGAVKIRPAKLQLAAAVA